MVKDCVQTGRVPGAVSNLARLGALGALMQRGSLRANLLGVALGRDACRVPITSVTSELRVAQSQGVRNDGNRAEGHGCARDHWA